MAATGLKGWSGPYRDEKLDRDYFYNEQTQASSWENPKAEWEFKMMYVYGILTEAMLTVSREPSDDTDLPALQFDG